MNLYKLMVLLPPALRVMWKPNLSDEYPIAAAEDSNVLSNNTYELCAEFARNIAEERDCFYKDYWSHDADRQCFKLEARDVELGQAERNLARL